MQAQQERYSYLDLKVNELWGMMHVHKLDRQRPSRMGQGRRYIGRTYNDLALCALPDFARDTAGSMSCSNGY